MSRDCSRFARGGCALTGNIITIHQSIPLNGMATVSLSLEVRQETGDLSGMVEEMEGLRGVREVAILSRSETMIKAAIMGYGTVGAGVYEAG